MKKLVLLNLMLTFSLNIFSQNFKWVKNIGTGVCLGMGITQDSNGNIYTIGYYTNTLDFNPGSNTTNIKSIGADDIFISKVDSSGKFIWVRTFGSTGRDFGKSIACDNYGNIYLMGLYAGTTDFNPGIDTANLRGKGTFLLKLDPSGNYKWVKAFAATGVSMVLDAFGTAYIIGDFNGTVDFDPSPKTYDMTAWSTDIFIAKINSSGKLSWAKSFKGGYGENASSIAVDNIGNVYTTGTFTLECDFDPNVKTYKILSIGQSDIFISKLDSLGNFVWAKNIGGYDEDHVLSLSCDNKQNILVTGTFQGTVDFDPGTKKQPVEVKAGLEDIFILKLNKSGNFVWVKRIGGYEYDRALCIKTDLWGNVYYAGNFKATVDFDPGIAVYNLTSKSTDIFFSKLDSSGNFIWAKNIGGYNWASCENIFVNLYGDTYLTGHFYGKMDFDPGIGTNEITSSGNLDAYILKTLPCINRPANAKSIIGDTALCEKSQSTFSINWVSGATRYDWEVPSDAKIIKGKNSNIVTVLFGKTSGYVKVTPINSCGKGLPDSIKINISLFPTIIITPASPSLCFGNSVSLTASGADSYLWIPSEGLNDSTTMKVTAKPAYTATYIVKGKNKQGCEDTAKVTVIVYPKPAITKQPLDTSLNVGSDALFAVTASNLTASYQWQLDSGVGFVDVSNGGQYAGVTDDNLSINSVKHSQNSYKFRCIVSEDGCSDTSNTVSMTVNCKLSITTQPSNQTVDVGSKVLFNSTSSSNSANYQWLLDNGSGFVKLTNGGQYSGATNDTLTISNVNYSQNNYYFKCVAEDDGCFDSTNTALLKVNCISSITTHPNNETANEGANVSFTVVSSSYTATYQWQQNSGTGFSNLSNGGQYFGVTNDSLTITYLTFSQNNYSYRCKVDDQGCSDSTKIALLTVKTIGINKVLNSDIKIYPNPANSKIFIELTNGALTYDKLEIFNSNGQKCLSIIMDIGSESIEVDVEKLNKGLYLVKLMNDDGYIYTKMIKN